MRVTVKGCRALIQRLTAHLATWQADGRVKLPGDVLLELPSELVIDALPIGTAGEFRIEFPRLPRPRVTKMLAGLRLAGPITELRIAADGSRAQVAIQGLPDVTVEFFPD
jgi:hypothetical protein